MKNEILGNLSIGYTIAIYLNSFLENIKEEKFSKFIFFSLIIFILQPTYLQKKYSVLEEIGDKKEILVYFGDKYYVSKIYDTKLNELESNFNVVFFDDIKNGLKIKKYEILEITHKKIWE
ncbi:MAG: hypothetical protein N4A44_04685 [Alphaproteobacteria bacterium]|nr:hypothetical protein [Alphaproteobacteria bacterium]